MTKPFIPTASPAVDTAYSAQPARQVAALCYRRTAGKKDLEVLLITSRGTGRWILPKGWPMSDRSDAEAALQEAWEEAGVAPGAILEGSIGHFDYLKREDDGTDIPVEVEVFRVKVDTLADTFPEVSERQRKWVRPDQAVDMVEEPRLKNILRALAQKG